MTALQFLSAVKADRGLRRSIAASVTEGLFDFRHSPVEFEPEETQKRFRKDLEDALYLSQNPLDSLIYLRSNGWPHDHDMHQVMENGYRKIGEQTERIFTERCHALGYEGPIADPSWVTVDGRECLAVQIDEIISECSFIAVRTTNGQLGRSSNGCISFSKESWLKIDSILRPFEDRDVVGEIRRDFKRYWRKDFGHGYHPSLTLLLE